MIEGILLDATGTVGDALSNKRKEREAMEAIARFWKNINRTPDGCWEWTASCYANGYGSFYVNRKKIKAHRFAYETLVGIIPLDLEIDHICRNRKCVNPAHMELVTRSENIRRGLLPEIGRQYQESKTHCPKGHPYDDENTYLRPDRPGRDCRLCRKEAYGRWLVKC